MIPIAKPNFDGNEEEYVIEAIRSTWASRGPFIERFEAEFAKECGVDHCLTVCNGTVALHLALLALNVRPGDEVIVPSLTYVATANAVRYVGAEPVFVDVDESSWCIDPKQIQSKITRKTRGIIAVHLYGHPADMDAINRVAGIHGLWVVEDAAEAHFAKYKGRPVGSLSTISTFSFFGNKIITCGEGGAVLTDDPQLAMRLRILRGQGVDPDRRYYFPVVGYNFRLSNMACAMLCAQLERKDHFIKRRMEIFAKYDEKMNWSRTRMHRRNDDVEPAPWLYCTLLEPRQAFIDMLAENGIETRPFFIPVHTLPPYATKDVLEITERLGRIGLNLPTFVDLSNETIDKICSLIRDLEIEIT